MKRAGSGTGVLSERVGCGRQAGKFTCERDTGVWCRSGALGTSRDGARETRDLSYTRKAGTLLAPAWGSGSCPPLLVCLPLSCPL